MLSGNSHCAQDERLKYCEKLLETPLIKRKMVVSLSIHDGMDRLEEEILRSKSTLIILLDYEPTNLWHSLLEKIPKESYVHNTWLILSLPSDGNKPHFKDTIVSITRLNKFNIDSHVYILMDYKSKEGLFEIYKYCQDKKPVIRTLISFGPGSLIRKTKQFIWNRRKNVKKCEIRVAYVNYYGFHESSEAEKYETGRKGAVISHSGKTFYGLRRPIFNTVMNILNFSIYWVTPKDNVFGSFDPKTGNWNGMIKLLSSNKAEMSVNWFWVTSLRAKVIRFSIPFQTIKYKLFRKKSQPSTRWGTFTNVLSSKYLEVMLSLILLCISCYFFELLVLQHMTNDKTCSLFHQLKTAFLTVCFSMVGHDVGIVQTTTWSDTTSKRLLLATICFFGIMNFYVYNGGLISSLMVQKYETTPIRELTDFHNKPEYKLLIDNNVAVESYLSISTDTEYQKLWAKVKKESGVLREAHSGENMIKKDAKKILLSSSPLFENSHDSYPCEIETTRYSYGQERVAFAFNNESVYIKLFDYHI